MRVGGNFINTEGKGGKRKHSSCGANKIGLKVGKETRLAMEQSFIESSLTKINFKIFFSVSLKNFFSKFADIQIDSAYENV